MAETPRPRPEPLSPEQHRALGVEYFNAVWKLLDAPARTASDDLTMIHLAHASRHHWGHAAGATPVNLVRGEWQVSRVYAVVGRAEPARFHAERCLELCVAGAIDGFDLAYAHEALARAAQVAGDSEALARHLALARAEAASVPAKDLANLQADLQELEG
ncbi:MAG: hypothetical protein IT370_22430 [Deltaproteobacteria bacterium]|nr:hypothetical protein [Deltaproteobacteria bacterium]